MRISIRLDPDHADKLDQLVQATQARTSEVVKQAIDFYYERLRPKTASAAEIFGANGFIGCGMAEASLSETYKEDLAQLLDAKHPA